MALTKDKPAARQRVRIRFAKQGDLRWIGHRDLARAMERLFRRAGLRLGMSEGFHPKPRMSFPSALAVGIVGRNEVMELELAEPRDTASIEAALARCAVPGLVFHRVEVLPTEDKIRKAHLTTATYEIALPEDRRREAADRAARLMAASHVPWHRPPRPEPLDLRPFLDALDVSEGVLRMRLRVTSGAQPGPRDVLGAMDLADLEREGAPLTRANVEVAS